MGSGYEITREGNLEGVASKVAYYSNKDHCFYALDTSEHLNDSFALRRVSDKVTTDILYLQNSGVIIGKSIKTLYFYGDNTVAIVVSSPIVMDFSINNWRDTLEHIRFDYSSKEVIFYFDEV